MSSWPQIPLGEILEERRETPLDADLSSGAVPIVEKIGFNSGKISLRVGGVTNTGMIVVKPGDLLVSGINAAKGAIALHDLEGIGEIAATIHYGAYLPDTSRVSSKFLWWLLRSAVFQELLATHVPGGIKTELKAKRLLPIPIPVPSLAEQQRIVARIEEVAGQIVEARELRAASDVKSLQLLNSSERSLWSPLLSTMGPLSEFVTVRGGGTPAKSNLAFWLGSIPWITPKDMKVREIQDARNHITELATQQTAAKLHMPNAVLVVVRGMILMHTVPVAVLKRTAAINQDMKALIVKESILPEFLCAFLWTFNTDLLSLVEKSSHDTRKLETDRLLSFQIPVVPHESQRRIVAELNLLRTEAIKLKWIQIESTAELDALLPAVLDRAFKGEL